MRRALVVSAALHLIAAAPFVVRAVLMPTVTPKPAPIFAQVELIQQDTPTVGDAPPASSQAAQPAPPPSPPPPVAPTVPAEQAEIAAAPRVPPPPQPPAPEDQPTTQAAPAQSNSSEAPAIRLGDGGAAGTGLVSGAAVIPAGLDATVHNRLPAYPAEAARRGEEGVVVVLVQIAPDGSASTVDVRESSGYDALDDAARAAVSRWRFRPAVEQGQPIASMMEVEVHFDIRRKPP